MTRDKLKLEILDENESIVSTHKIEQALTLVGKSPSAHVHLSGDDVAGLHIAIKNGPKPIVMDLGGPSPLKINGKITLEHVLEDIDVTLLEIGSRKMRVRRVKEPIADLRSQKWAPLTTDKQNELVVRVRLYIKGVPHDVATTANAYMLSEDYGVSSSFKLVYVQDKQVYAQLPSHWISLKGRVQIGSAGIAQLSEWEKPIALERDTVYRVYAGPYIAEILVTNGRVVIGAGTLDLFPKELRKPFGVSAGAVVVIMLLWLLLFGREEVEIEEPYPVYARIQNIPIEKLPEPEPSSDNQAGGGSGSPVTESAASQIGAAVAAAPSAAAQALTGGLKNLIGSVLSHSKSSNVVVAETGIGQAAPIAGGASAQAGKMAAVGTGSSAVAGASKLGNLAVKGSGQGFSGGSGTGLGTGHGSGIGTGVGDGIGRGGFRLVEEESIVDGGLDKSVIAAVIQNNLAQIKYCYERQLVADPDLFGKVVVLWQINAAGIVEGATVKQTTLNSAPVEKCMLAKISGWKFPQPKNGTRVSVSYPFLFKSTK